MTGTTGTLALILLGALVALPASAAVLLAGYGTANSEEAARAAAREDLGRRLQRAVVLRLRSESASRAFVEGREFPLIGIELASAGAGDTELRYEARLADASLAAYEREAAWLAGRLRKIDLAGIAEGCARWNEINIRPIVDHPGQFKPRIAARQRARPSFSGEVILLSLSRLRLAPPARNRRAGRKAGS